MNVVILIPCHNEEKSIAIVIAQLKKILPEAEIIICDNASTDKTAEVAGQSGAVVISEYRKGKGNAMRRLFAEAKGDVFVMLDGDGTYEVEALPKMIDRLCVENLDMVIGTRAEETGDKAYRAGHKTGNQLFNKIVSTLFGAGFTDIFSGYRVMSRRFVKSFPVLSNGFEIETEMTVHLLRLKASFAEMPTRYADRIAGTTSKLSTYKDGLKILRFIIFYFKEVKPFEFFTLISLFLMIVSLWLGIPVVLEYLEMGIVERFPTAFLSMGVMISGLLSFITGVILDGVSRARLEAKILLYLQIPFVRNK